MTRDEVLALEPGRKLDALVAKKVMGWEANWLNTDWWEEINPNTHRHKGLVKDFKPSTDISAAWEVLEKMGGFTLVPAGRNIYGKISFWYAGKKYIDGNKVYEVNDVRNPTTGCGETAPEAICKAALLAVIGREDEYERY